VIVVADKVIEHWSQMERPMNRVQCAEFLQVSASTVDRLRRVGVIPTFKRDQTLLFWRDEVRNALRGGSDGKLAV
jgi:hypothetical protein